MSMQGFLVALLFALAGTGAQAATYTVTTLGGGMGTCTPAGADFQCDTVRGAFAAANASAESDLIDFAPGLSGDILIGETLSVVTAASGGALNLRGRLAAGGQPAIRISGDNARRVMTIGSGADVSIEALGIVNGDAGVDGGGGIYIAAQGAVSIAYSTISGNTAAGGGAGIFNNGTVSIEYSTLSGNSAPGSAFGGGIANWSGGVLIVRFSTLSGNSAYGGGGIAAFATASIEHSTVSGNHVIQFGGGIFVSNGPFSIAHSTLSNNSSLTGGGGGISSGVEFHADIHITASVIAYSNNTGDCLFPHVAPIITNTLVQDGLCVVAGVNGNLTGDPRLDPLAGNGGVTRTHLPQPGSPLLDALGDCSMEHPTDQRGIARPQDSACDIGAVERRWAMLQVNASGHGKIDILPAPSGGAIIDCREGDSPCMATYTEGDALLVALMATPDSGWHLAGWGGDCSGGASTALVDMDANRACTASFAPNYSVQFLDWDGSLLDTQNVPPGGAATPPTPPARPGYLFIGWDASYVNVDSDRTLTAQYTIDASFATDLSILAQLTAPAYRPGDTVHFALHVANAGPNAANDARVQWTPPAELPDVEWFCEAQGAATCAASGSDSLDDLVDLPANGSVSYLIQATLPDTPLDIANHAQVSPGPGQVDPDSSDDTTAWHFNTDLLFRDGFEQP